MSNGYVELYLTDKGWDTTQRTWEAEVQSALGGSRRKYSVAVTSDVDTAVGHNGIVLVSGLQNGDKAKVENRLVKLGLADRQLRSSGSTTASDWGSPDDESDYED